MRRSNNDGRVPNQALPCRRCRLVWLKGVARTNGSPVYVHRYGCACSRLYHCSHSSIRSSKSATLVKSPRLRNLRASTLKNSSTWLSHDPCLGVKWNTWSWSGSLRNARRCCPVSISFLDTLMPHQPATNKHTAKLQCVFKLSTNQ